MRENWDSELSEINYPSFLTELINIKLRFLTRKKKEYLLKMF